MRELLLYLFNLWVGDCSPDEALERADGVAEVRCLDTLRALSNRPLLEAERHERSGRIAASVSV